MKNTVLLIWFFLLMPLCAFCNVYHWVDRQGTTHFSDKAHRGATEITLSPAQTYKAPAITSSNLVKNNSSNAFTEYKISIVAPADQTTITPGNAGNVFIKIKLKPNLKKIDKLRLLLNKKIIFLGNVNSHQFTNLSRGTYVVQAQIIRRKKQSDKIIAQSGKIIFYVRRTSILQTIL